LPNLAVQVEKGRLNLLEGNRTVFWFQDIRAKMTLPPKKLKIDLACQSNLWQDMKIEGWVDSRNLTIEGRVDLTAFRPDVLAGYLAPTMPLRVEDARADLGLRFKGDGHASLQAEVEGSIPSLTLQRGEGKLVVKE